MFCRAGADITGPLNTKQREHKAQKEQKLLSLRILFVWNLVGISGNRSHSTLKVKNRTGVYIMQNTMVGGRGGGEWSLGKKMKNEELGKKLNKKRWKRP